MSIVYVNNWNGYSGGIFGNVEDAIEDMAILAVAKGIEGHQDWMEDFLTATNTLGDFTGKRNDWNLYAISTSKQEMYSINTHDTDTRPGLASRSTTMLDDTMIHPAWAVQKALYDYIWSDSVEDDIRSSLEILIKEQIDTVLDDVKFPEEALNALKGNWGTFGSAVHSKLFEGADQDPAAFIEGLPQRAVEVYDQVITLTFNNTARPKSS